jgi:hypothetical protein
MIITLPFLLLVPLKALGGVESGGRPFHYAVISQSTLFLQ